LEQSAVFARRLVEEPPNQRPCVVQLGLEKGRQRLNLSDAAAIRYMLARPQV
jgi:ribosomal protein L30/L7E